MRFAILVVIAAGCGARGAPPAAPPSALPDFAAARWVPAQPMYVLASASLGDAQRTARDALDLVGAATGFDLRDAMRMSSELFGVDALHPDPLAAIGVDVRGSWTVFGSDSGPTLVVHLAAPAQMAGYLEHQRERGLVTRAVVVDRVEVTSAVLPIGLTVSWAIDGDWMWVHLALPGTSDDAGAWFAASHAPHTAGWADSWAWAHRAASATASLVGVFDVHGAIGNAAARLPDAVACARVAAPVQRIALAVEGDAHHVAARVALDVGSTERLRQMVLPPPRGWDATAAGAAIAAQWNLDLAAARPWLAPCLALVGAPIAQLDETGVRAARGMLLEFDPDAIAGRGAVALDLTTPAYFDRQLDRIPLRHTLESDRSFGPYRGKVISIPFSATIEYVLEPRLAIAALGEGLIDRLVGASAAPRRSGTPIFALDLAPPALSREAWQAIVDGTTGRSRDGGDRASRRIVEQLMSWRDGHLAVTAESGEIVVTASGNRR